MEKANIITKTTFAVASNATVSKLSSIDITNQFVSTSFKRNVLSHNNFGPDVWGNQICVICKNKYRHCNGHFGIFSNVLIYRTMFIPTILKILNNICYVCKNYRESKDTACKVCKTAKCKYVIQKYIKMYKNNKTDPFVIERVTSVGQKQVVSREAVYDILSTVGPNVLEKLEINIENGIDLMWTNFPILGKRYRKDNKVGDRIMKNHIESLYQQMSRQVVDRVSNLNNQDKLTKIDNIIQTIEMQLVNGDKYKRSDGSTNSTILTKLVKKDGIIIDALVCHRTNNCIRAVIIPANENISVDEIGIPLIYASELTVFEHVTIFNIHKLNDMLGNKDYPNIKFRREIINGETVDRSSIGIDKLNIGDLIARSLINGDEVLANRAPTLHKNSILCFKSRIISGKALALNIATCAGFGADFDGDQMNIFALKGGNTRIECYMKMSVSENAFSSGFSGILVALTQDLVSAIRILTTDEFEVNKQYMEVLTYKLNITRPIEDKKVYSGKYIFSTILPIELNFNENSVLIENGVLLKGIIDKTFVMKQQKGLLTAINDLYGEYRMIEFIDNLHILASNFLRIYGLTTGLHDFYFSKSQMDQINYSKNTKYHTLYEKVKKYNYINPQIDMAISKEVKFIQNTNEVLHDIMENEFHHFHDIITSGAKGTTGDVNQMCYTVGQVYIGADRYVDRSPLIAKYDNSSRFGLGIVERGYLNSLNAIDIQMCNQNAMNSAITTQIVTAKPGYINTKINETVRDFIFTADFTVRNPIGEILIQHYFNSFDSDKEAMYTLNCKLDDLQITEEESKSYSLIEYKKFNSYISKIYNMVDKSVLKLNRYETIRRINIYLPFDFELLLLNNRVVGSVFQDMSYIIKRIDGILKGYNTSPYREVDNINKVGVALSLYYYFHPKRISISLETYDRLFDIIMEKIIFAQLDSGSDILLKGGTSFMSVLTQEILKSIHQTQSRNTSKQLEDAFNVSKEVKNEVITSYVDKYDNNIKRLNVQEILSDIKCIYAKDTNKRIYKILYSDDYEFTKPGLLFQFKINMLSMITNNLLLPYISSGIIQELDNIIQNDSTLMKTLKYLHVSSSGIFEEPCINIMVDGSITNVRMFIIHFVKLIKEINIRETSITSIYVVEREFKHKVVRIEGIQYKDALDLKFIKPDHVLTSNLYSVYEMFGMFGYFASSLINLFLIGKDNKVNPKHAAALLFAICNNNKLISLNRQGLDKISTGKWSNIAFESQANNLTKAALKNVVDYGKSINSQNILGHKSKLGTNHSTITFDINALKNMSRYKLQVPDENQLFNMMRNKSNL